MSYQSVILADNPIRYYRLGESSGTVAVDSGSQAQNGTLNGGITLGQTGLLVGDANTSMLFDGSTGYITVPTTGFPSGVQAISLECWLSTTSLPGAGTYDFVVDVGTVVAEEELSLYTNNSEIQFGFKAGGNIVSSAITANTTYHVVGTWDGTNLRLYINGSLVGSPTADASANLTIGACTIGDQVGATGLRFPGTIDEVAIYNTALSAARVAAHYTAGRTVGLGCTLAGIGTLSETFTLATHLSDTLAGVGTLIANLSVTGMTIQFLTATWVTRDGIAAAWVTRDEKATWKTRS